MYTKIPKNAENMLKALLFLAAAWLALRYMLPYIAPFAAAFAVAAALEGVVSRLTEKVGIPRSIASGACVLIFVAGVLGLLYALCSRVLGELSGFVQRLPGLLDSVSDTLTSWQNRLSAYFSSDAQDYTGRILDSLTEQVKKLPSILSGALISWVTAAAAAAPTVLLFAVTAVIGAYFTSSSYNEILHFAALQLPEHVLVKARKIRMGLRSTIVRWFRAQILLMLITFIELTIAFLLLGINYALLLALFTAVVDALPVLGTGTVLIPWAIYDMLTGRMSTGIGLAITYGAVTVLRSCIQAKLLGDQLGLHPLVTLLAIYTGYMAWGVTGMIIFPIAAITIKQLNDAGMIHLWKTPESKKEGDTHGRNHIQYNSGNGNEHTGGNEYSLR